MTVIRLLTTTKINLHEKSYKAKRNLPKSTDPRSVIALRTRVSGHIIVQNFAV